MKKSPKQRGGYWKKSPDSNQWNQDENWEGDKIPTDEAEFSESENTLIEFSEQCKAVINSIIFRDEAPSFNITIRQFNEWPTLTIQGDGIQNYSGKIQCINVASKGIGPWQPQLHFINKSSAGSFDVSYYAGPTSLMKGYGGGVIGFANEATAGEASFTVRTGAVQPPSKSTVGAEVSFKDNSNAGTARFFIFGTLGDDGDTFGNVVFHDQASALFAVFTNYGGTVAKGDGGNTQFYDQSNVADGKFFNFGGTVPESNGGDVAFDGNANGGNGTFYNYAATAKGAYGGVTSFNNNPPYMKDLGASAGSGFYYNYGAPHEDSGGGGHTELTAKYGSPTAGNAQFFNYGSAVEKRSSAGHTILSISQPAKYFPTAGNAIFWNYPGLKRGGAAGYTEFAVYDDGSNSGVPNAGNAIFHNMGGQSDGVLGGFTSFKGSSDAKNAKLIAYAGTNNGLGGQVYFSDNSVGGSASVELIGNGMLNLTDHSGELSIANLKLQGGVIKSNIGRLTNTILVADKLELTGLKSAFSFVFGDEFEFDKMYKILIASNMSEYNEEQFEGSSFESVAPKFIIEDNNLFVVFLK